MVENFDEKIPYMKKPLSIKTQIAKLKDRGLIIDDENLASEYLMNISYYRLRAYTYPFQNNTDPDADHKFIQQDVYFKDIIDLYCFDRRLRSLIFNAIEKIEVAIRTKIIQIYSESTNDSHWFENQSLFSENIVTLKNGEQKLIYDKLLEDIVREVDRSNEDFINHYKKKYSTPKNPPAWMSLEVVSMGTLSYLYKLLKKDRNKKAIAKQFGLSEIFILENWLHAFSILRNSCAHHSRIWNRRFIIRMLLPYNTDSLFLDKDTIRKIRDNKLFAYLCCIKYILDRISPGNDFYKNLNELITNGGKLLSLKEMGFPDNWKYLGVWK